MKFDFKKCLAVMAGFLIALSFTGCSSAEKLSVDASKGWKMVLGDNKVYSQKDYDDSAWSAVDSISGVNLGKKGEYLWIRNTLTVPAEFNDGQVWIEFGKNNTCGEIFVDGIFIGGWGRMPPEVNIRIEHESAVLVPANLIHNGKINVSVRLYCAEDRIQDVVPALDNGAMGYYKNNVRNVFTQRLFLILTSICAFILIYSLCEFFGNTKDLAFLYYSLCIVALIFYFYDMGSENLIFPYAITRSLSRAALPVSLSFLALFLNTFFKRKGSKKLLIILMVADAVELVIYLLIAGRNSAINTMFTIMLIPVVGCLVYGFVCTIHAIRHKEFGGWPMFIGFVGATIFAVHDVIYQAMGAVPFIWTQGFAFFFIDIAVFVALSMRSSSNQREVISLAGETQSQKDRLEFIFQSARALAEESSQVSSALATSVASVIKSADSTTKKISEINTALHVQEQVRSETSHAVLILSKFMEEMNSKFETEARMIENTTKGTKNIMDGIQTVGNGINSAAAFSNSMSALTQAGSADMKKLVNVMEEVQKSSAEILGVVTTLDDFAQQTDLLSMNASIEAAHSGEAGKGFAVIAHEIKSLASQTSQWSSRIGEIITSVIAQIKTSVDLSAKVNAALSKIETGSVESSQKVNGAAQGIRVQQDAGEEIAKDSVSLSQMSSQMMNSLKENNNYVVQVKDNMQKLVEAGLSVNDASSSISKEAKALESEASRLNELSRRTSETAEKLLELMGK